MLKIDELINYEALHYLKQSAFCYNNRKLYEEVPTYIKEEILKDGKESYEKEFPFISHALFQEFSINGNRSRFEKVFFEKRKNLGSLILAEAIADCGYISKIEEGLWSILSELSWTIPAHNSYIRDSEQLNEPDISRPILDLFSCETGEILSLSVAILKPKLNPIIVKNINYDLEKRIKEPYLSYHFWWMGRKGEKLINWTPWCTQNVLLSLIFLPLEDKELQKIVKLAVSSLDWYIESFPEDGCCDEGASYYHAAGTALFGALYLLSLLDSNVNKIFSEQKLKNIAEYIENVHIADDLYLNFADCSIKAGTLGCREYLFAKAVNSNSLLQHASHDFKTYSFKESDNNYNLFYRALALMYAKEITQVKEIEYKKPSFKHYGEVGLTIFRREALTLAVKSGCNNDSHNHNDTGSIILFSKNKPILIDIGVQTYTKQTFSSERYDIWTMQSLYHNVVNFSGIGQGFGPTYRAENCSVSKDSISFNLEKAYPKNIVSYYKRSISVKANEIDITDETISDLYPVLTFMTIEKPRIVGNQMQFASSLFTISSSDIKVETIEITDERLRKALPEKIYRILIKFDKILFTKITL